MTFATRVRDGLRACGVGPSDRVLVAVSGGLDSVTLLRTLSGLGQPLVACHVDHQLRPGSEEDGAFVATLAADLGVLVERVAVEVPPGNVQAEARRVRYAALAEAARQHACPFVATGHTADDQAETVLAALVRGAGLRGLAGVPPARPLGEGTMLVRPMLDLRRAEVEVEARAQGWTWRDDPSNASKVYSRNWLRHNVMPLLESMGGQEVASRIAASADAARAAGDLVRLWLEGASDGPDRLRLDALADLSEAARALVLAEAVAAWAPSVSRSRPLLERLARLPEAQVGTRVDAAGLRVWREADALRFDPEPGIGPGGSLVVTPLRAVPASFSADPLEEIVDADAVAGAVETRRWRDGDRIRPLGLHGSQLVSDLLRDRGVPRADRDRVPVVLVGGDVAWVVGHRLAAFAAVRPDTTRAVRWTWRADGEGR
ncbi:tRNA lysidine(34) synthetase TilS [Rubrivirga marina]|uniref:tRNA(Ile)-lysidine synthase n=1 Tax=Rubrivirga marina TaxID=1196024 RepID=A0A271J0X4_9BACT|nr:tRNA lysidine(34) synthetase TilS [Rubrivirga marina]PAP77171.1 tRNA lysidine(34) synthetase TilS [Rubrivirga marina]